MNEEEEIKLQIGEVGRTKELNFSKSKRMRGKDRNREK